MKKIYILSIKEMKKVDINIFHADAKQKRR
jgi:hypothetical protein